MAVIVLDISPQNAFVVTSCLNGCWGWFWVMENGSSDLISILENANLCIDNAPLVSVLYAIYKVLKCNAFILVVSAFSLQLACCTKQYNK